MKPEVQDAGRRRQHESSSSGPAACTQLQEGDFSPFVLETEHPLEALGEQRFLLWQKGRSTLSTHTFFFTCRNPILNEQLILSLKHSISQPPELHQALGLKFWNAQTEQQALQFLEPPIHTHWCSKTTHLHLSISNTKKHSVAYLNIMWPFSNL